MVLQEAPAHAIIWGYAPENDVVVTLIAGGQEYYTPTFTGIEFTFLLCHGAEFLLHHGSIYDTACGRYLL